MEKMTVDAFVETRVLPEFQPIVAKLRTMLKEIAPALKEEISYGIPAYRLEQIVAVISPTKKDITLAFSRGAEFEDKYLLLRGVGKVSRHIKLRVVEDVQLEVIDYYLQQAMRKDRIH